jgi:prepilin-type N-terminal cleavage/methylation domain-containing protein
MRRTPALPNLSPLLRSAPAIKRRAAGGFTLFEAMIVVAIVGILAYMATPSLLELARHTRSHENARKVQYALTAARARAQKTNAPVRIAVVSDGIAVQDPVFAAGSLPTDVVRRVTGFATERTHLLTDLSAVELLKDGLSFPAGDAGATLVFCPSGDANVRYDGTTTPVCPLGDMTSSDARLRFTANDGVWHVDVRRALGGVELKRGS